MTRFTKIFIAVSIFLTIAACTSNNSNNSSSGDTGDSATIGTGPDTSGSMVDTGSSVTDTTVTQDSQ
jgi:hypothetical protein